MVEDITNLITIAYDEAVNRWLADDDRPVEITESVYNDSLNVLPPIYGKGSHFWVSEPYTHDLEEQPIYLECWREDSRYFCRMSRVR